MLLVSDQPLLHQMVLRIAGNSVNILVKVSFSMIKSATRRSFISFPSACFTTSSKPVHVSIHRNVSYESSIPSASGVRSHIHLGCNHNAPWIFLPRIGHSLPCASATASSNVISFGVASVIPLGCGSVWQRCFSCATHACIGAMYGQHQEAAMRKSACV